MYRQWLLSTNYNMGRKKKKTNFAVKKPKKQYLSQAINVNINSLSHVDSIYPWYEAMKTALYPCSLPLKAHNASLTSKKISGKKKWETSYKIPNRYSSQLNAMWYSEWDPETAKRHLVKTKKIWMKTLYICIDFGEW